MSHPRLIFFGTSSFAVPALERLAAHDAVSVIAVITQPDLPAGRNQTMMPSPVKVAAQGLGLAVWQPRTLKDDAALRQIQDAKPDVGIVAAYGKIIPKPVLNAFPRGLLNIHPSLLPKYRGPSPIQQAILNGDTETGVTIMKVDADVDHGPIVAQATHRLRGEETAAELMTTLAGDGADLLTTTLVPYLDGTIAPRDQEHARATSTKMITRDDGRVDASLAPEDVFRRFRAYQPWPGIWTSVPRGAKKIRVKLTDVAIKNNALVIRRVQPEGKSEMTYDDFLRGYRFPLF